MHETMHDLAAELNAFMDGLLERADPATADLFAASQGRQAAPGQRAIAIGDTAPDFTLPDPSGAQVSLHALLRHGTVVVLFVRGGWCPFCTITLRAYDRLRPILEAAGATLLAISPQTHANNIDTSERQALHFPLLSDAGLRVAEAYGLVWQPDADMQGLLRHLGHDVPRINGTSDWRLPIPAGFVIGQDGKVHAARVSPNIADRMPPSQALETVRALAS